MISRLQCLHAPLGRCLLLVTAAPSNAQHVQRWRAQVVAHGVPQTAVAARGRGVRLEDGRWEYAAVLGARKAPECFGGWEYRVRWRDWQGDTWETAHALQAEPGSQLERDMATARARKCVPHSLRARLERLAQGTKAAGRTKGERLLEACEAGVADDAEN